uniref:Protein S-acyltransferase n=1 Tax=Alexandrium andersonii TaxID=327968 RepID=A0A7S2HJ93_9DINO
MRNHREFMVMISSLVVLALVGLASDCSLLAVRGMPHNARSQVILALHLVGSCALCCFLLPVWRLHCGLIARSELAFEWKWEEFRVVQDSTTGTRVSISTLDQDEYEALRAVGTVSYDPGLNRFDKGWRQNCMAFWCTARWSPEELGEF